MKRVEIAAFAATTTTLAPPAFNRELWERINAFDCSIVTRTFAERNVVFGAQAKELEIETKRFLYLAVLLPNVELAPTKPIDEYWHQFILFTEEYHYFCQAFGGEYIQHNPLAGPNHATIFDETQRFVHLYFGEEFDGIKYWNLPMPATSCRCTNATNHYRYVTIQ